MQWENHFRAMKRESVDMRGARGSISRDISGDKPMAFEFGVIPVLGNHTRAELKDLIAAHTYSLDQLEKGANDTFSKLPLDTADWQADFAALRTRFEAAKKKGEALLESFSILPANMSPAEDEYVGILKALKKTYPDQSVSKGDLTDLDKRLTEYGGHADYSLMPQPSSGSDIEMQALQVAQAATKPIDTAGKTIFTPKNIALAAGGAVASLVLLKKIGLL